MSHQDQEMKAPYYPSIYYQKTQTRFGAVETNYPNLYQNPLPGKLILEVDTLSALEELWGDRIFLNRELTYKLVSGACEESQYQKLLTSYYVRHAKFTSYVDEAVSFGDSNISLLTRIVRPAREVIDREIERTVAKIQEQGGKIVMITHDFVYATFKHKDIPTFKRARIIE